MLHCARLLFEKVEKPTVWAKTVIEESNLGPGEPHRFECGAGEVPQAGKTLPPPSGRGILASVLDALPATN